MTTDSPNPGSGLMVRRFNADCTVCRYWEAKIKDQRERALNGDQYSYKREMKAQRELNLHLARHNHVFGTEAEPQTAKETTAK